MRSATFPYAERYAHGVSPLGPICYFDTGDQGAARSLGQARTAPPIILVHALGLNMTQWEHVAPALASHTRVIGLDLPGCGHSARPRHPYSLKMMAQAVVGLMDFLKIDRAILMGHSFGGAVVADVALHHPGRVAGLVLMNSSGFTRYPRALHAAAWLLFRPVVVAPVIGRAVNHVLQGIFHTRNQHTDRFVSQVIGHRDQTQYAWEFARYASPMIQDIMSNFLHRLDELTLPVLVIWGDKDALLRYKDVPKWVSRLKDAHLVTISNCGHMPNLEYPDTVSAAIVEFLDRFSRAAPSSMQAG